MGKAHQKRQRPLFRGTTRRGEDRRFGGCPSVPAPGAHTAYKTCGRPQNRGAVTGERGQMAASLSSYFIPAAMTQPPPAAGTSKHGRDKEEN